MSFVLRTTSTSATGRQIVRTRRMDADIVTIGRDPASDIHLTDLEVTRHHAAIRRIGPQRVLIEALASIPLIVEGRSTERAELDVGRGGEIRIGATRITLAAGETDSEIALDISSVEPAAESSVDASHRFALSAVAPGKRWMAWTLALLILAGFLAWPIWSFHETNAKLTDRQMAAGHVHADASWSAGPLSRAHAALERDCKACHVGAFVAVPDSACRSCHADIQDHADPRRLHAARAPPEGIDGLKRRIATMFGRDPGRCVDCHVEHQGATTMPPPAQAFCADCHAALKTHLTDTKLADAGDFATSHPQFAPVVMTVPGEHPRFTRISLDDAPTEDTVLKFPHALHLSGTGGVARMATTLGGKPLACASCHVPDDSGARFKPVSMEANCQQCHSLALDRVDGTVRTLRHGDTAQVIADIRDFAASHPGGSAVVPTMRQRPGEIRPTALAGGGGAAAMIRGVFSKGGACYDCHVVRGPSSPGGTDFSVVPVRQPMRYLAHGWFDHGAHASTTCESCHGQALKSDSSGALMIPGIANCRQCHGGEHAYSPLVRSSCVMCHDYHRGPGAPHVSRTAGHADREPVAPLRLEWRGEGDADRPDIGSASGVRRR
jgi:hypothetical protein